MEDLDGDGLILQMRVPDTDGEWKVCAKDPRLYLEGYIKNYDGVEIKVAPHRWGLDLNRQFPVSWEPEAKQAGAGPFPLSEPETRAIAEFLLSQKNITGGQSYHTTSGVILRPSSFRSDDR